MLRAGLGEHQHQPGWIMFSGRTSASHTSAGDGGASGPARLAAGSLIASPAGYRGWPTKPDVLPQPSICSHCGHGLVGGPFSARSTTSFDIRSSTRSK